jgi:hypothetical protein
MKRFVRAVVAVVVVFISLIVLPVVLRAVVPIDSGPISTLTVYAINTAEGDQYDPHVDGEKVVYTSIVGSTSEVRYYNFVTSDDLPIPQSANDIDQLGDISNGKIAFSRLDGLTFHEAIELFDTNTSMTTEIDPSPNSHHGTSAIGANTVAFIDADLSTVGELVIATIGGATVRVTNDTRIDQRPSVAPSGNVVVFESCQASASNCDIHQAVWNGTNWGVTNITNNAEPESYPDTDGSIVVYDATRSGERDIYWQPVGGGAEQRLVLAGEQRNPSVSGGLVAFESVAPSSPTADLFVYHIATNRLFRITSTPEDDLLSDVSALGNGEFHLVWTVGNSPERNVYGVRIELPAVSGGNYSFGGFLQPVDPLPTVNVMKAGAAVPVKFSLGGNKGLNIFATGYPRSASIPCSSTALTAAIEETATAGGSSLQYDATTDVYTYIWKTDKGWAGTCRQLVIQFADSSVQYANFKFK